MVQSLASLVRMNRHLPEIETRSWRGLGVTVTQHGGTWELVTHTLGWIRNLASLFQNYPGLRGSIIIIIFLGIEEWNTGSSLSPGFKQLHLIPSGLGIASWPGS